jgi:glycerol-3-phosphate acyltransferase PlsY
MNITPEMLMLLLMMGAAYLVGSIPSGLWISMACRGVDPRTAGSGNMGATNILRVVGKREAILTLVADIVKGWLPVVVGHLLKVEERFVLLIGSSAILGHVFPIFLKLKGGKGVAVSLGVFLGVAPQIALISFIIWLAGVYGGKYSSAGALAAFGALPFLAFFLKPDMEFIVFSVMLSILVYVRHWENIRRLLHGEEKQV